jgi:predicted amidohydrolase YtcJ
MRTFSTRFATAVSLITFSLFNHTAFSAPSPFAETVILNGKVITADSDRADAITMVEAIAIQGNRIMAVGTNAQIRALIADWTEVIDAKGNSVIPGLIDTHNHLYEHTLDFDWSLAAIPEMLEVRVNVSDNPESFTEVVLAAIKARAAQIPEGQWIRVNARPPDAAVRAFGTTITRSTLDQIAPNHPTYITTRGGSVVNTKTIEAFEEFYGSRMPEDYWLVSRELGTSGEYNDFDRCAKIDIINTQMGSFDRYIKGYMETMQVNAQIGVTAYSTHLQCEGGFSATAHLDRNNMMPIRLAWNHRWWQPFNNNIRESYRRIGDWVGYGSDYMWSTGSSVGGIDAGGVGWCATIPAADDIKGREQCPPPTPGVNVAGITDANIVPNRGRRVEHLDTLAQLAGEGRMTNIPGWHVAGDGALEVLFQTYRTHMSDERIRDLRIAGDHCFGVRPDQIEMAARLGHTFSCNFDTENTIIIEEDYGDEYLAWNLPVASMLKAGVNTVISTFGSYGRVRTSPFEDSPNWLTRTDKKGDPWGLAEEAVPDRLTLLLMMSRYGSYPVWKEKSIGSIEVGKLADIVLLNGDFLAVPVDELGTLKSVMTIIGGQVTSELPELRGNTLWFDTNDAKWIMQMNTPTTIWRWKEEPQIPPFLQGASGY